MIRAKKTDRTYLVELPSGQCYVRNRRFLRPLVVGSRLLWLVLLLLPLILVEELMLTRPRKTKPHAARAVLRVWARKMLRWLARASSGEKTSLIDAKLGDAKLKSDYLGVLNCFVAVVTPRRCAFLGENRLPGRRSASLNCFVAVVTPVDDMLKNGI